MIQLSIVPYPSKILSSMLFFLPFQKEFVFYGVSLKSFVNERCIEF